MTTSNPIPTVKKFNDLTQEEQQKVIEINTQNDIEMQQVALKYFNNISEMGLNPYHELFWMAARFSGTMLFNVQEGFLESDHNTIEQDFYSKIKEIRNNIESGENVLNIDEMGECTCEEIKASQVKH